ncbi:MAG: catalase [Nitrospirales bacterium]
MNYAIVVVMILAMVGCDTVPTHPDDEIHAAHLNVIQRHKHDMPYPEVDSNPKFFTEHKYPNEEILAYQIADEVMYTVDRNANKGVKKASRDAHPKENGCVKAEFHTYKDLDRSFAKGVFADGHVYEALIRFSNSSENPAGNDHDNDARGMAIKLTHQLEKGNGQTRKYPLKEEQDFIMINHPVFILDDPSDYLSLSEAQNTENAVVKGLKLVSALWFKGIVNAKETIFQDKKVKNPLQTQYYSMVPYRLGAERDPERRAIKFSAKPYPLNSSESSIFQDADVSCVVITSAEPQEHDKNYLRTSLRETLHKGDACMGFMVQEGTKEMSVENSQVEWEEKGISKFRMVALIKIPKQPLGEWKESACEDKSFDPWHAREEHRPLGVVNRLRKVIYPIVSDYRQCLNYPDKEGC